MLKISPIVIAKDVPGDLVKTSYALYPDTADPNLYYALAETPTYAAGPDGGPSFNLTWYFGSGATAGGICTLTVALPIPDLNKKGVRDSIAGALNQDQSVRNIAEKTYDLCRAFEVNDTAKINALKADLGLSDKAAADKKAVFDKSRDWQQFLPAAGSLKISAIPFKSGSVAVQAFLSEELYQQGSPEYSSGKIQTTPSLINSNAAVVTFNLKDTGANLFWHGLGGWAFDGTGGKVSGFDAGKGGQSVVTVAYNIAFDGMLPEAKATVTLNKSVIAKLDVESQVKRGSWGREYREDVVRGKEYRDAIQSATKIELPAVSSAQDKDNIQKLLTDWSARQLEDMTKSQFPNVKLEDLDLNGARKISAVTDQSRSYSLSQAVTIPKSPQAQLPKIDGLVQKDDLKKYFQLINLNDRPYFNVDLTVRAPNLDYLKLRQVERFVVTQLTYANDKLRSSDGKEVSTLEFVVGETQAPGRTLSGTFDSRTPNKSLEYSYLVAYSDGAPSYQVNGVKQSGGDNYLDLGGVDIGVLSVSLDSIDLPWDVIVSAKVDLAYGDWTKTVALRKGEKPLVVKPFGKAINKPLSYKLTINLATGAPQTGPEVTIAPVRGNAEITLRNPLGDMLNPISFSLDSKVSKAQLRVEYTLRGGGADRVFQQMIQLDSSNPETKTYVWKTPVFSGEPSSFKVTKARVTVDGSTRDLTDLSGGTEDPAQQGMEVTVLPDGISIF